MDRTTLRRFDAAITDAIALAEQHGVDRHTREGLADYARSCRIQLCGLVHDATIAPSTDAREGHAR